MSKKESALRDGEMPVHAGDTSWSLFEGEAIILDLAKGMYYHLNPVASRIWELCDGSRTAKEVAEVICRDYDVARDQAEGDVRGLLAQFIEQGLIASPVPMADQRDPTSPGPS
jgi:pyrroloquinoline quinone biosynthesis protein D